MKPTEFFSTYDLHDSVVVNIEYNPSELRVSISLELCQWKQTFYVETEPEMREGVLSFTGVTSFQIEPSSFQIDSNEIFEVKSTVSSRVIEIVLTGGDDVGVISFEAEEAIWNQTDSPNGA
ncbi:hypothetical protein JCM10914A_29060 [Paenibacillus sp. JCM 10914]|uniref:hypothetical protein n=1 Tax=Paenibacillus sp. JCM 10914 TaxID=1236974 RepID=UPI0005600B07|nr:hypothetical protein [Paenibacillus sp. JCM 10914]